MREGLFHSRGRNPRFRYNHPSQTGASAPGYEKISREYTLVSQARLKSIIYRRGFSLVDLLIAIMLAGAFFLLVFRLLGANMDLSRSTRIANNNTARFDRAVAQLREDVRQSRSIETPAPASLNIHGQGSQIVQWSISTTTIKRTNGNETRTWDVGQKLDLKLDGAIVLLTTTAGDQLAMAARPPGESQ